MKTQTGGFLVLGIDASRSIVFVERWPMITCKVKTTEITPRGTRKSCKIMWGSEGSETEVAGHTLDVYNRYVDIDIDMFGMAKINHDTQQWEFQEANVCQS
jgi:hypothetical protein